MPSWPGIASARPRVCQGCVCFIAVLVSDLVLAETTWVLDTVYERTGEQIATAIDMLLNHERLTVQDADVRLQ